jgi:hypothetical protein
MSPAPEETAFCQAKIALASPLEPTNRYFDPAFEANGTFHATVPSEFMRHAFAVACEAVDESAYEQPGLPWKRLAAPMFRS